MKARDRGEGRHRLLSDQQWDKIQVASGLPPKARDSIELDILSYITLQETRSAPPAKIRKKLRTLRNQARKLLKGFEEALGHDDVYYALVSVGPREWHPRNPEQRKRLAEHHRTEKVRTDLNALIDWLDLSERKLSRGKPGSSPQNVWLFVEWIDNALDYYTNKRLTRSRRHRRMMEQIFAIVDREVGKGTIDTAMRAAIGAGRSRRAGKLLPGSRVSYASVYR
jgi:hypothetical protein